MGPLRIHKRAHADQPVRLVQVLYSLGLGGSEMLGRAIAAGLQGQGFTSAVCALDRGGEIEKDLRERGIPFFIAGRTPDEHLSVMVRIYRFFRLFRPHIVHTHHLYDLVYSILGAKLVGAKVIHTEHEYFSLLSGRARLLLRILSFFCERITSVGPKITDYLREGVGIRQDRLVTIPNGVDLERYSPTLAPSPEISSFAAGRAVIGTVARLEKEKGQSTLLKAFEQIQRVERKTVLVLVGDGSLRKSLESESSKLNIDDRVLFMGSRNDIPPLLAAMDVFVLSSVQEGLPIALLEAMSMAKAVIATSVGNIPQVIKHRETGILVDPENPDALAEQILRLLNEPAYARSLGEAARKLIMREYDLRQSLARYEALYRKVLGV